MIKDTLIDRIKQKYPETYSMKLVRLQETKKKMTTLFGFPIKKFNEENLLKEMLNSNNGDLFLLGEKRIKHFEGDDSVELIFAEVKITRDVSPNFKN